MKEFIEKLTKKLYENVKSKSCPDEACWAHLNKNCDNCDSKEIKVEDVIRIANELAEGYNNESVKGDLISRNNLLQKFCINSDGRRIPEVDCDNREITVSIKDIKRIIREQPTAYNDGWIPVEQRLPDRCQYVLCTVSGNLEPKHEVVICAYNGEIFWHDGSITAWHPLPAPYQPKGENNGI